jgi:hypothetical protein
MQNTVYNEIWLRVYHIPHAITILLTCDQSQWPSGLRRESAVAVLLDCGFEFRRGHGCLSLVERRVLSGRCHVDVSATNHSSIGVLPSVVCLIGRDSEPSLMRSPRPTRVYSATGEQNYFMRLRLQQDWCWRCRSYGGGFLYLLRASLRLKMVTYVASKRHDSVTQ